MNNKLFLYDIKELTNIFTNNKKVIAYGNGSFYEKIKNILEQFNFKFCDILYTKNDNIVSISGKDYNDLVKEASILVCSTFSDEIINIIKKQEIQPRDIKIATFEGNQKYIEDYKKKLPEIMKKKHFKLLQSLQYKTKIRVVFFVFLKAIWKVDYIFKRMLEDTLFEPLILIVPHTRYGQDNMWQDMNEAYYYFKNKKYPVIFSYNEDEKRWLTLKEIKPDIIFFTLPFKGTFYEYYENAYFNYLSCYAGYGINTVSYNDNQPQYNLIFHNSMYKIFTQTKDMLQNYLSFSYVNKNNLHLVIDNTIERLKDSRNTNSSGLKKINWAPHHTTLDNDPSQLSTFLKFSEYFKNIAEKKKFNIFLVFKPHPELKVKLYSHPDWGKIKTDKYYDFWTENSNSSLEEGEYIDLFQESDGMILDSASFLAEYIFTKKPMLFLTKPETKNYLNKFGLSCLNSIYTTDNTLFIDKFINEIIQNKYKVRNKQLKIIEKYFKDLGCNSTSQSILNILKNQIKGNI